MLGLPIGDDEAWDCVTGGPLGYWKLELAFDATRSLLEETFSWRNRLNPNALRDDPHFYGEAWPDVCTTHAFADQACSQAAVGAFAPLVESLGKSFAKALRVRYAAGRLKVHERDRAHHRWRLTEDDFWDPTVKREDVELSQNVEDERKDDGYENTKERSFFTGFPQLLKALGLRDAVPPRSQRFMDALFAYRNQALHYGYEWPKEVAKRFAARIAREVWAAWFSITTSGGEPWLISLSDAFVKGAFDELEALAAALRDVDLRLGRGESG